MTKNMAVKCDGLGCITAEGLGRISRIDGNMDAALYVEILNDDFLDPSDLKSQTKIFFSKTDPEHT